MIEEPNTLKEKNLENQRLRKISIFLIFLYSIQGTIIGLIYRTIPYFLKEKMSFTDLGLYTLSQYSFSLKIIWSPIIDTYSNKKLGKRKTWIFYSQWVVAALLFYNYLSIDEILEKSHNIYLLTISSFFLLLSICFQDVALDGWALDLVGVENCLLQVSCERIGVTIGSFISSTIFLALNSVDFCNNFIYSTSQVTPIITLSQLSLFLAIIFVITNVFIYFFIPENFQKSKTAESKVPDSKTLKETFKDIIKLLKLPSLRKLLLIILTSNVGRIFFYHIRLILVNRGLSKDYFSITQALDVFTHLAFTFYFSKKIKTDNLMTKLLKSNLAGIISELLVLIFIFNFELIYSSKIYFLPIYLVLSTISNYNLVYSMTCKSGFFNKIADRSIGSTYLSILHSANHISIKWPGLLIFPLIDYIGDINVGIFCITTNFLYFFMLRSKFYEIDKIPSDEWKLNEKIKENNKSE